MYFFPPSLFSQELYRKDSFREEPLLFSVAWFALCWIGSNMRKFVLSFEGYYSISVLFLDDFLYYFFEVLLKIKQVKTNREMKFREKKNK